MNAPFSIDELRRYSNLARSVVEHGHKMLDRHRVDLYQRIKAFTTLTGMDVATLAKAKKEDFGYKTHGHLVVEQVIKEGEEDLFVQMWRQHFLNVMKPKCMPCHWEVSRPVFKTREQFDSYR